MNSITCKLADGTTWKRVGKVQARKAYAAGTTIGVCGCNADPSGVFGMAGDVKYTPGCGVRPDDGPAACFEQMENAALYYLDPALGRYLSFYVQVRG